MSHDKMVPKDEFHDVRIARDKLAKDLENDDNVIGTAIQERHGKHSIVVYVKRNNVHGMETLVNGYSVHHEQLIEEGAD